MPLDWNQPLPRDQLRPFLVRSDLAGWRMLAFNWGLILLCFALVMWRANLWSVALALVVLGGRQLGLGILMHESAHRSLFQSQRLNEWVGQWLCAAPMFVELATYRRYHMIHHIQAGTLDDPDPPNYQHYPVSRASLRRKLLRDLSSRSGLRAFAALLALYGLDTDAARAAGYSYRSAAGGNNWRARTLLATSWRCGIANALMLAACFAAGHALAYLLWPVAWLTTYMLFSRIRNAAEHGALPGTREPDIWRNTRTVLASWWERLTVAPNYVNYHFEHHLAPAVPAHRLPAFHRWLHAQGAYGRATLERGYARVLARMVGER
jgi:fatty acid desaturase